MRSADLSADGGHAEQGTCGSQDAVRTRLRPLKVATRVRIPLGVLTVEPQVAARFVPLSWGFLVSDDHLVVYGSCHEPARAWLGGVPDHGQPRVRRRGGRGR